VPEIQASSARLPIRTVRCERDNCGIRNALSDLDMLVQLRRPRQRPALTDSAGVLRSLTRKGEKPVDICARGRAYGVVTWLRNHAEPFVCHRLGGCARFSRG
jgi:hypothetical protein